MSKNQFFSKEHYKRPMDVVSIENALIDILVQVDENTLDSFKMKKGIMQLVETKQQKEILEKLKHIIPKIELGGSAANVLRGLSLLGAKTTYSSAVGDDLYGNLFAKRMAELGIKNRLSTVNALATGVCLVAVTPDGERTLNTSLGACQKYKPEYVPYDDIINSKSFFSTGYMLDTQGQIDALHAAFNHARYNNVKIAFDIGDPFIISRHGKNVIYSLLEKVDLVFLNSEEAKMLLGYNGDRAALYLSGYVEIAVIKDGENGAYIAYDRAVHYIPSQSVEVVDTTGAGDLFAAGFLFGLCKGYSIEKSGQIASLLASDVITRLGVELSPKILGSVENILTQ